MADLRTEHPDKAVELWCEDEARVGLKPVTRRVWALRGTRPTTCGRHKFESVQVFGFAHPASGRSRLWLHPKTNAESMGEALRAFADWADPDGAKVLVLVVDNAGYHTAKKLAVPANVVLHFLPSCTPELQPAERLWPLLREAVANRVFDDLAAVSAAVTARAAWMADHPEVVGGVIGFHWAVAA